MKIDKSLLVAWSASILLHSLLVLTLIRPGVDAVDTSEPMVNRPIFVDLLPPNTESKDLISDSRDIAVDQTYPLDSLICGDKIKSYRGAGLLYSTFTNLVSYAPEYYPAYKSGIRVGDKLLNPGAFANANGIMTLYIDRDGKILTFDVPVAEICYNQ